MRASGNPSEASEAVLAAPNFASQCLPGWVNGFLWAALQFWGRIESFTPSVYVRHATVWFLGFIFRSLVNLSGL